MTPPRKGQLVVIDGACPDLISYGVANKLRRTSIKVATPFALDWPSCGCDSVTQVDALVAASAMGSRRQQAERVARDGVVALVPRGELALLKRFAPDRDVDRGRWILSLRRDWPAPDLYVAATSTDVTDSPIETSDAFFWMNTLHPMSFGGNETHVFTEETSDAIVKRIVTKIIFMYKERQSAC